MNRAEMKRRALRRPEERVVTRDTYNRNVQDALWEPMEDISAHGRVEVRDTRTSQRFIVSIR